MSDKYVVFKRSARNFEEFAKARKQVIRANLTIHEARSLCESWNNDRTSTQIKRGTKLEFEHQ